MGTTPTLSDCTVAVNTSKMGTTPTLSDCTAAVNTPKMGTTTTLSDCTVAVVISKMGTTPTLRDRTVAVNIKTNQKPTNKQKGGRPPTLTALSLGIHLKLGIKSLFNSGIVVIVPRPLDPFRQVQCLCGEISNLSLIHI